MVHYLLFTPPDFHYISVADNFFASSWTLFEFSTDSADDGIYVIAVTVNPGAETQFRLNSFSPNLWPQETDQVLFSVPPDIALTEFIYLPVSIRQ